jgi:hypothetical protein
MLGGGVMSSGYSGPSERLGLYEKLVARIPAVERKGKTMPYTSRNGHMFSFLDPAGSMALRLPPDARDEFLSRYGTTIVEQHGRTLKDYVIVPDSPLERTDELQEWFARSHDWVGSLKPKPTPRHSPDAKS